MKEATDSDQRGLGPGYLTRSFIAAQLAHGLGIEVRASGPAPFIYACFYPGYYNIHKMMNITRNSLKATELNFVQEVASVFAPVGMPSSVGRVYGYLLLKQSPISLDQIASDLSLSKGGAWNAARVLERYGQVQRYSEPGGKRAMYAPSENFGSSFLALISLLGTFGNVLQSGASTVTAGKASVRLAARAKFHILLRQAVETAIIELNASCQSSARSAAESPVGQKDSTVESVA